MNESWSPDPRVSRSGGGDCGEREVKGRDDDDEDRRRQGRTRRGEEAAEHTEKESGTAGEGRIEEKQGVMR